MKFDKYPTQMYTGSEGSSSLSDLQDMECQRKTDNDVLGLDLDVLEVSLQDILTAPGKCLSYEHLDNCLKNVEKYHLQLQDMHAKNAQKMAH